MLILFRRPENKTILSKLSNSSNQIIVINLRKMVTSIWRPVRDPPLVLPSRSSPAWSASPSRPVQGSRACNKNWSNLSVHLPHGPRQTTLRHISTAPAGSPAVYRLQIFAQQFEGIHRTIALVSCPTLPRPGTLLTSTTRLPHHTQHTQPDSAPQIVAVILYS